MRLYEHGLKVVLRKIDNFLPTLGADYLLAGRGGLTRREIARHSRRRRRELRRLFRGAGQRSSACSANGCCARRPMPAAASPTCSRLLKLGAGVSRLEPRGAAPPRRLLHQVGGRHPRPLFQPRSRPGPVRLRRVVGHYASPYAPGSAYVLLHHVFGEAAGVAGAWGHAIGGMGAITQAMAKACREEGVEIVLDAPVDEIIVEKRPRRGRRRRRQGLSRQGGRGRASIRSCCSTDCCPRARSRRRSSRRMAGWASESATFRMNVALSELPRFTSLPEPGDHMTAGIIIAPSLGYMDRAWLSARTEGFSARADRRDADPLDPGRQPRARPGQHVASLFCQHFPYEVPGGWDARRDEAADAIIAHVDRYAPGFAAIGRRPAGALAARPRAPLRPDRRRHLPRQDGARPALLEPADARPCRLPHAARRASICAARAPIPAAASPARPATMPRAAILADRHGS